MERGLVPKPIKVSLGYPNGVFNRFPAYACEQVRFVAAMRAEGSRSTRSTPSSPPGTGPRLAFRRRLGTHRAMMRRRPLALLSVAAAS
jgi:hypothetical protein